MSQIPILVAASKLTKSPTNVRKTSDAAADAQLEANIAEKGLIQNLIGVPVARKKGHYRITAGGRRLDAVHRLIDRNVFEPDYMLPVLILPDAKDAIEISLAENFFRLAMNPAEACRAFEDIIASEGKSPADVAKRFGVTERFVLGRLRLAGLAEPVFDALANGEITLDVAMAYASTSDCERQAAVFGQLAGGYARGNSGEIRRQLAAYSYRATDPKALLVGRDAYVDAGGRIDQDLFSDAESERWLDTHIVDRLAEERLAAAAEAIQTREGYGEVRIVPAAHVPYADTYSLEPIRGDLPPLNAEAEARQTEIEEELSAIEAAAGDDGVDEETDARIEALECELTAIAQRTPIISDEQRASAVAYVVIGQDGTPRIHEQLYVAPVESGEDDGEHDEGDGEHSEADAAGDGKPAISQRLADELAMMKTELLAVHVASDPGFALDLGTFFMVEAATRTMGSYGLPSDLRATAPTPRVHGFDSGTAAAAEWVKLDAGLDRSWAEPDTIEGRYDAFCALSDEARAAWLGWAIARMRSMALQSTSACWSSTRAGLVSRSATSPLTLPRHCRSSSLFLPDWLPRINVFQCEERGLAQGDRIQWRLANKPLDLKNAERGTVEMLDGTLATVRWDRDKAVKVIDLAEHRTWDHGYAETVYSAQSKTYARAYVLAPVNSALVNGQNYYTAVTRARFGVKLWTEDVDRLANKLSTQTGEKTSASEGLGKIKLSSSRDKAAAVPNVALLRRNSALRDAPNSDHGVFRRDHRLPVPPSPNFVANIVARAVTVGDLFERMIAKRAPATESHSDDDPGQIRHVPKFDR